MGNAHILINFLQATIPPAIFYQDPRQLPPSAASVHRRIAQASTPRTQQVQANEAGKTRQRCSQCKASGHNSKYNLDICIYQYYNYHTD